VRPVERIDHSFEIVQQIEERIVEASMKTLGIPSAYEIKRVKRKSQDMTYVEESKRWETFCSF